MLCSTREYECGEKSMFYNIQWNNIWVNQFDNQQIWYVYYLNNKPKLCPSQSMNFMTSGAKTWNGTAILVPVFRFSKLCLFHDDLVQHLINWGYHLALQTPGLLFETEHYNLDRVDSWWLWSKVYKNENLQQK